MKTREEQHKLDLMAEEGIPRTLADQYEVVEGKLTEIEPANKTNPAAEKTEKEILLAILTETKKTTKATNLIGIQVTKIRGWITFLGVIVILGVILTILF